MTRKPGESDFDYKERLIVMKINRLIDTDWDELCQLLQLDCTPDHLRKVAYGIYESYTNRMNRDGDDPSYDARVELNKERMKLQTEKVEYYRWMRENAREELYWEKLCSVVARAGAFPIPDPVEHQPGKREAVLFISDQHYGVDFKIYGVNGEIINEYRPEIFEQRMSYLLDQVIGLMGEYELTTIKIVSCGDSLDGLLRHSQLQRLRWGVIDCAVNYAFYMASWLNVLSQYMTIEFYNTFGNHTEMRLLDGKKGEHTRENIDKAIMAILKTSLKDNPNISIVENPTGYVCTMVCGYTLFAFHGEGKSLPAALKDYSDFYGVQIDYIAGGHYHHNSFQNCGVRKGAIGVGSIMGVDEYAQSLKRHADPSASLVTFEYGKGKVREDTIVLD